jgi:hypothetical protein
MVTYNPVRPAFTALRHLHLVTFISSPLSRHVYEFVAPMLRMRTTARQEGRVLPALRRKAAARAEEANGQD